MRPEDEPVIEPAAEITLTATDRFTPDTVTIQVGQTVRWRNAASKFHTVTPDRETQPGVWVGAPMSSAQQTFTHRFTMAGVYAYHCEPHLGSEMRGVIIVRD